MRNNLFIAEEYVRLVVLHTCWITSLLGKPAMKSPLVLLQKLGSITPGINPKRYEKETGSIYSLISVKDLDSLLIGSVQTEVQLCIPKPEKHQLIKNDVVIAIRGSLLKSSVITETLEGSVSNPNTAFFRCYTNIIDPVYLAVLLRSGYVEQLPSFRKMSRTTTLPGIRVNDLRNLEIPLPELSIQHQISHLFVSLEKLTRSVTSEIETRNSLAQAALSRVLEI